MRPLEKETDIEVLRQAALVLERENQRLTQKVVELTRRLLIAEGAEKQALQLQLAKLEQQLASRNHLLFGDSSEKRPRPGTGKVPKAERTGHGPRAQPDLPIVDTVYELDEADRQCPTCGGALAEMKGQFEESEEIDVVERRFVLRKVKRKKYRCACNECIETALGPPKLFNGARYSVDFAIEVVVGKYLDHLPLERQVRMMAREGLVVDSQTLWDQVNALARVLAPAHDALHRHVLGEPVIGADETTWRLMGPRGEDGGACKRWYAWAVAGPNAVCYQIVDGRSAEHAAKALLDFSGKVMVDGYAAYETLSKRSGRFVLAFCWAHVRRKYLEAEQFQPEAKEVLDLIGQLYEIERLCPTGPPGDELRRQLRAERSRPLVSRIHAWALEQRPLPQSALGKAIAYMGGLWPGLVRFLDDPAIPLDNNATERALRGVVLGRKNHYGSRSRRGTEVAALFYSLMESAKLAGVEPKAYLRRAAAAALAGETIPLPHQITTA